MTTTSARPGYLATATSSASDNWPTPLYVVDMLAAEFGPFDLDPAADPSNAKAPLFYTADDDGLAQDWKGHVWLNPPYGSTIRKWVRKAIEETTSLRCDVVVMLVPVRPDTRWWREALAASALVRFWPGRIEFRPGMPAPFPSAIFVFGKLAKRHGTEPAWCKVCKRVFWPAYACRKTCSPGCRKAEYRARAVPNSPLKSGQLEVTT